MGITKKQKEVFDYIDRYSQDFGYAPTQKEIKDHFGFKSFGSVQRYIKYLVNAGYLEGDWNARRGLKTVSHQEDYNIADIPLLGKIAAGNPIEAIENPDETISVPINFIRSGHKHFALRIEGDSMIEDGILNEDIVVCKYSQTAEQGETIAAVVDGEATLKHFYKHSDHIELRPANSSMSPIKIVSENFKIAGILVGLVRSYV